MRETEQSSGEGESNEDKLLETTKDIVEYVQDAEAGSAKRVTFYDQLALLKSSYWGGGSGFSSSHTRGFMSGPMGGPIYLSTPDPVYRSPREDKRIVLETMIVEHHGMIEGYPEAHDELQERIGKLISTQAALTDNKNEEEVRTEVVRILEGVGKVSFANKQREQISDTSSSETGNISIEDIVFTPQMREQRVIRKEEAYKKREFERQMRERANEVALELLKYIKGKKSD